MSYPSTEAAIFSSQSHPEKRPEVSPKPSALSTVVSLPRQSFRPTSSDPIQDAFQEEMLWFFHMEGYWGLAFTIWSRAIELASNAPKSYWRFLAEDFTNQNFHLFTLLLTLPVPVIESLIKNTLPHDVVHDAIVRKFVTTAMRPACTEFHFFSQQPNPMVQVDECKQSMSAAVARIKLFHNKYQNLANGVYPFLARPEVAHKVNHVHKKVEHLDANKRYLTTGIKALTFDHTLEQSEATDIARNIQGIKRDIMDHDEDQRRHMAQIDEDVKAVREILGLAAANPTLAMILYGDVPDCKKIMEAVEQQWTQSMQRIVIMENQVYDLEKAMEKAAANAAMEHVDHRIARLEEMVYQALEAVDVDMQLTRHTVENELAETAEVLGAFEYQDTLYHEDVRRLREEASLEIALLQQRILDMDGELKIALRQRDLVRRSHSLARQRTGILQRLLEDTERELQKTVIERNIALLVNDNLELAMNNAGYRHDQELNALTEAYNIALQAANEKAETAERAMSDAARQHKQEMKIVKEVHRTEIQAARQETETAQAALAREIHEKSWAETAIQLARGSDRLLDSSNSNLGDVTLVRDIQSTLYLVRQGQGKVMTFEEKDIECVKWTGLRVELCLRECAGLPVALRELTLQYDHVQEYAVLGWIAHLNDSLHRLETE